MIPLETRCSSKIPFTGDHKSRTGKVTLWRRDPHSIPLISSEVIRVRQRGHYLEDDLLSHESSLSFGFNRTGTEGSYLEDVVSRFTLLCVVVERGGPHFNIGSDSRCPSPSGTQELVWTGLISGISSQRYSVSTLSHPLTQYQVYGTWEGVTKMVLNHLK